MPSLSRILVPVEFSPRCRGAVQYAEALSCHFHCEIVLLHVVMPPLANFTSFEAMAYTSAGDLAREIANSERRTCRLSPVVCRPMRMCGASCWRAIPTQNIVEFACRREMRPDRDANPRIWTLPPLPAGIGYRQGAARCDLSGVDRAPHGERAGLQFGPLPQHRLCHRSGTAQPRSAVLGRRVCPGVRRATCRLSTPFPRRPRAWAASISTPTGGLS